MNPQKHLAFWSALLLAVAVLGEPLFIGGSRECFFDDALLEKEATQATLIVHHPVLRGPVLRHDAPWEGSGCNYHNFFFDDAWPGYDGMHPNGVYRMYYLGWQCPSGLPSAPPGHAIVACYAESPDGIHWTKPNLGICSYQGIRDTNIVVDNPLLGHEFIDNFMVFRDDNPACPKEQRYKGISLYHHALWAFYSPDGIIFTLGNKVASKGVFDSLNVVFWDAIAGKYRGYVRGNHFDPKGRPTDFGGAIRDINYIESVDFLHWTEPELINFTTDPEDIALYTNCMSPYFRAPRFIIGFPTRYVERVVWNGSFEQLGGLEKRQARMKLSKRYGTTVTDCIFAVSRNGRDFARYMDAFLRPEPENGENWVYGDCYPALGFAVTPNDRVPGAPDELSMYLPTNHFTDNPAELNRYTLRMDGFASLHAGGHEVTALTKPFVYEGKDMFMNFETSAFGYMFITLIDEAGNRFPSCETFGNTTDRKVIFDDAEAVAKLSGKPVRLEFRMMDADIYSMQFR